MEDLLIVKARENCRVGKYLDDSVGHLKRSIDDLEDAIELLNAVHYDFHVEKLKEAKSILETITDNLNKNSTDLFIEAMALTDRAERKNS